LLLPPRSALKAAPRKLTLRRFTAHLHALLLVSA